MVYFHIFITYTFISSAVLFYGIEINRTIQASTSSLKISFKVFIKAFLSVLATTILSYLVTDSILIPIKLGELYPLISILIFLCLNTFVEALVRITAGTSTSEFAVSWLIVLLSLSESSSLVESIIICCSCSLSFFLMQPIVSAFQKRMYDATDDSKEKMNVFLFLSIAVLMMVFSVFDISWFNL